MTCRVVSASRSRSRAPAQVHVGAAGRGGVPVVDDNERAVRAEPRIGAITEPESLEQAGMGDLGILAPDHDHPRPITDLAERGGRGATQRHRGGARPVPGQRAGRDQRPEPIGERHGRPGVVHCGPVEAVQQRTAGRAQQLCGVGQSGLDIGRLAADRRGRCVLRARNALGEPLRAKIAPRQQAQVVARALDQHVVAQQCTPRAGDRSELSHRQAPLRESQTADARHTRRAPWPPRSLRSACTRAHRV